MPKIPDHLVSLKGGFKAFMSPPPDGVVRLTVGEPAFDTPSDVSEAAINAIRSGDTHYTRGEGRESLCAAWASHLRNRWDIPVQDDGIVVTPGAKQALLYAIMVAAGPGDEVILMAPSWPTHVEQVELVVWIDGANCYAIDAAREQGLNDALLIGDAFAPPRRAAAHLPPASSRWRARGRR